MDAPYRLVKLSAPADVERLQRLLERCSDSYELHEGWPTPPDAAEYELTAVPSASTPDELCILALADDGGTLHAAAQLLRNYPERGIWWIGLLIVAPELRSRGIGSLLFRHARETAAAAGATAFRLVVSIHNPRAQRFWEAAGFRDTGELRPVSARSGHVDTVRIMELGSSLR